MASDSPARSLRKLVLIAIEDHAAALGGNGTVAELHRRIPRRSRGSLVVALRWLETWGYVRLECRRGMLVRWTARPGALGHYLAQLAIVREQEEQRRQWNAGVSPADWRPIPPRPRWPASFGGQP